MYRIMVVAFILVPLALMAKEFVSGRKREFNNKRMRITFPIGCIFAILFLLTFYFSHVFLEKVVPQPLEYITLLLGGGFFITFLIIFFKKASILFIMGLAFTFSPFLFQFLYRSFSPILAIDFSIAFTIVGVFFLMISMILMLKKRFS